MGKNKPKYALWGRAKPLFSPGSLSLPWPFKKISEHDDRWIIDHKSATLLSAGWETYIIENPSKEHPSDDGTLSAAD